VGEPSLWLVYRKNDPIEKMLDESTYGKVFSAPEPDCDAARPLSASGSPPNFLLTPYPKFVNALAHTHCFIAFRHWTEQQSSRTVRAFVKRKGLFMSIRGFSWWFSLAALAVTTALGTGCVSNGRQVLLKEYGPSVPPFPGQGLKGITVCIDHIECASNIVSLQLKTKPEEPVNFKYLGLSHDQEKLWTSEAKALKKQSKKADWIVIGNMRNGFGIVMSHVYALNDPAGWVAEGLKFDLEQQGAKVVPPSEAASADVRISGIIQLCHVDMYITVSSEMVVDLQVQPKQGAPRQAQIHTHGATAAMLASEGEYFHALRDSREKFSILTAQEVLKAIKP
jgi:hypothetical protein